MLRHGNANHPRSPGTLLVSLMNLGQAAVENLGDHLVFILDAGVLERRNYLLRHRCGLILLWVALAVLCEGLLVAGLEQLEKNVFAAWTRRLA